MTCISDIVPSTSLPENSDKQGGVPSFSGKKIEEEKNDVEIFEGGMKKIKEFFQNRIPITYTCYRSFLPLKSNVDFKRVVKRIVAVVEFVLLLIAAFCFLGPVVGSLFLILPFLPLITDGVLVTYHKFKGSEGWGHFKDKIIEPLKEKIQSGMKRVQQYIPATFIVFRSFFPEKTWDYSDVKEVIEDAALLESFAFKWMIRPISIIIFPAILAVTLAIDGIRYLVKRAKGLSASISKTPPSEDVSRYEGGLRKIKTFFQNYLPIFYMVYNGLFVPGHKMDLKNLISRIIAITAFASGVAGAISLAGPVIVVVALALPLIIDGMLTLYYRFSKDSSGKPRKLGNFKIEIVKFAKKKVLACVEILKKYIPATFIVFRSFFPYKIWNGDEVVEKMEDLIFLEGLAMKWVSRPISIIILPAILVIILAIDLIRYLVKRAKATSCTKLLKKV